MTPMASVPVGAGPRPARRDRPALVRVVVADDDSLVRLYLTRVLAARGGYDVLGLGGGSAVLALLAGDAARASWRPDVLLLDVQMPDLSGLEVLAELGAAAPPAVLMSGVVSLHLRAEALRLGAAAVLEKPFTSDALHAALTRAVGALHLHATGGGQ